MQNVQFGEEKKIRSKEAANVGVERDREINIIKKKPPA